MNCCDLLTIVIAASAVMLGGSCTMTSDPVEPVREGRNSPAATSAERATGGADVGLSDPIDVEFVASVDGSAQRYVRLLPKGFDANEEHDVLIGLHGMGSDRWQYATQERGECKGSRDVAARFDMIYISPDYRGVDAGMNAKAEADVLQIIEMLREEYRVGKVFMTGGSMGGIAVLVFAARNPDVVDGVASANGLADHLFSDGPGRGHRRWVPAGEGSEDGELAPEFTPEKFTMPVAFTVSGADEMVPPHSIRRLFARLGELGKRDILLIDRGNAGHATNYADTVASLEFVIEAACAGE